MEGFYIIKAPCYNHAVSSDQCRPMSYINKCRVTSFWIWGSVCGIFIGVLPIFHAAEQLEKAVKRRIIQMNLNH